jgi:hypothetical protein
MEAIWQNVRRARPDPYLEWEYRTRNPHDRRDLWCSLQIQVVPVADEDYLPSLEALLAAVKRGWLDEDHVSEGFTIRMADDEQQYLIDVICGIKNHTICPPFDCVQMQFFVYRLESLIYADGKYANTSIYNALIAGPPIDRLRINEPVHGITPLTFPGLPLAEPVAIGIIDDGIGFAHERFCSGPESSRISAVWVQEVERERTPDHGVLFGQRLKQEDINKLLKTCKSDDQIYRKLGIIDFGRNAYNPLAARASHGTHVLDLAAGYEALLGVPSRPIFAVQLPSAATIDTSGVTMGSYVLQAVRMIMVWADRLAPEGKVPLVINFSYGILAGPKDGTHHLERALAKLIEFRNKRAPTALVLPTGNSYRVRTTARVTLDEGDTEKLDWVALPDAAAPNFIEMWLDEVDTECKVAPVEISLTAPDGSCGEPFRLEQGCIRLLMSEKGPIAGMCYDIDCETGRGRIFLAVGPSVRNEKGWPIAPSGRWMVSIENKINDEITAHWYVQRDDTPFGYPRRGRQSYLDHSKAYARDWKTGDYRAYADGCPLSYKETLSAIATAPCAATVVGAAEATDEFYERTHDAPPADYASSGPTKTRDEPDCSAIADDGDAHWGVLAAGTLSGSTVPMRGSSVAAPQIVRELADELAAAGAPSGVPPIPNPSGTKKIPVSRSDKARLGEFVLKPARRSWIPKRRYPAI